MILTVISAALGIISFLPLNLYPIGFVFLVPLFIFYTKENGFWKLIAGTALFRVLLSLGTVYYTLEPISWISSTLIFLGLPLSIFIIKKYIRKWNISIALPFLWVLFDHLQAQYSLVPTYIITAGNILGSSPFVGLAKPFGIIALTVFVVVINALLTAAYNKKWINCRTILAVVVLCIVGASLYSQLQLRTSSSPTRPDRQIKIASVSTNKEFDLADAYLLERDLTKTNADLIVLPESMLDESTSKDPVMWYRELAKTLRVPVIASMQQERSEQIYISTLVIEPDGSISGIHDKTRLTFMGEYWPFKSWRPSFIDWLAQHNIQMKSYAIFNPEHPYTVGTKNILTTTVRGMPLKIGSMICMEIQYPYDLNTYKDGGAQLIVTPTSNRWLSAGSDQFLYLTNNIRAIESVSTGIPIVTSGVNDATGMIAPNGTMQMTSAKAEGKRYAISISPISI